jgi:hypothetical protein
MRIRPIIRAGNTNQTETSHDKTCIELKVWRFFAFFYSVGACLLCRIGRTHARIESGFVSNPVIFDGNKVQSSKYWYTYSNANHRMRERERKR